MKIVSVTSAAPKREVMENQADIDVAAFSSTILASLLEVDINEATGDPKSVSPGQKKQPRKKTTNRPNPALLQLERQRMEELKKSDVKLKKKCVVKLRRAEDEFEVARKWVERGKKREQIPISKNNSNAQGDAAAPSKKVVDTSRGTRNSSTIPAKAPSGKKVETATSPTRDDKSSMEPDIELDSNVVKVKEIKNKDKKTEDPELRESGKQQAKVVMKEKIGEMLKAAIKAKISLKDQTLDKVRTGEKHKSVTKEDIKIKKEDVGYKEKNTDLKKVRGDEEEREAESERVSEKEKAKETEKESYSGDIPEAQQVVAKTKNLQSENISESHAVSEGEVIKEESGKDEEPSDEMEKEQEQSQIESEKMSELPESQVDETEIKFEAVAGFLEAETIQDDDNDVPEGDLLPNEELIEQEAENLVEAMDSSNDNGKPSAADLVVSIDVTELNEPPKELLDCALDEVIAMDGIELGEATEELMKALASPGALTSENATLDETDLDPDELIETLPLESTEPPEILLRDDDNGLSSESDPPPGETEKSSCGDTAQEASASSATSLKDVPAAGKIFG